MKIRTIVGVLSGLVVWWVLFYLSVGIFAALWPAMQEAGRPAVENGDFSQLTAPMLALLIVMYFWVNPVAGWLTVFITKNRNHVWVVVVPLFLFASFQHFYVLWDNLPDWYNVLVPILIPPLVYLGGIFAKTPTQSRGEQPV